MLKAVAAGPQSGGGEQVASVQAATTAVLAGTPAYDNGSSGVGATLTRGSNGALAAQDGITLVAGDRLLVKDQASGLQNGVYVVTVVGTAGTPYVLTRATDFNQSSNITWGTLVPVDAGTTLAGSIWMLSGTGTITVGTTALTFTESNTANIVTSAAVLTSGRIPMGDGARGLADTGAGTIGTSLAIAGATIGANALAVTGTAQFSGNITAFDHLGVGFALMGNATSIPAGGTAGAGYMLSSTANFGVFFGSGAPTLSGAQGSLYLRSNGVPYYNTNGTTGWNDVLVTGGALGTPASGVATNLTGTASGLTAGVASAVAVGGITGLGTGVATALAINTGSAGAPALVGGALGTASATSLSNAGNTTYTTASAGEILKQGANGRVGTFVANGATPVTVNNTSIAITDAIIISLNTVGGAGPIGQPVVLTITAATGFTVGATATDSSTYNYAIIKNAA